MSLSKSIKTISTIGVLLALAICYAAAQHIRIKNNQFYTDNGKRIWLNGVNTPWNKWNDFGGDFDRDWWNNHFQILRSNGINCTRVWISCNGNGAVKTGPRGVTG
ncbi:MAG TPA: hypothetical protein VHI78_10100, partial [Bacteroidales bacterium]|nr:hypothetical protein [Bacteroidales bacterium]